MSDINKMLSMKNWAVVGVSNDKSKWAYKVYKRLKDKGYNVFPINPKHDAVSCDICYKTLSEVPGGVDVVSMIVNPILGLKIVEEAAGLGIKNMWCQPGAESDELIQKAKEKDINIVYGECVLVELG